MKRDEKLEKQVTLNEEDTKKIIEWFNSHSKDDTKCPVCRQRSWFTRQSVFTPVIFNLEENHHVGTMLVPTVIVECKVCGNQLHFSANKVGIDIQKYNTSGGEK